MTDATDRERAEWLRDTLKGYREPSEADFRALDSLLSRLEAAEEDARQMRDALTGAKSHFDAMLAEAEAAFASLANADPALGRA